MSDVSCRATAALVEVLERDGAHPEALVAPGIPPLAVLRDVRRRVSWDEFVALVERVERCAGSAPFDRLGRHLHEIGWNRSLASLGRVAWTERQFWRVIVSRVAPSLFRPLLFAIEDLPGGRFRMSVEIPEDRRGSLAMLHFFAGLSRCGPHFLGHAVDAEVECELSPRRGVFTVTPVVAHTPTGRLLRRLRGHLLGHGVVEELNVRQHELERGLAELESARARLEKANEELRASEERWHALAGGALDLIAEMDLDGRLLWVSPNVHDILGLQPAELIDRNLLELLHPDHAAEVRQAFAGALRAGESDRTTMRLPDVRGAWHWFDATARGYRNASGEMRVLTVSREITDARRASAELESRGRDLAALNAVTEALHDRLDFESLAQRAVDAVVAHMPVHSAVCYRLDASASQLELVSACRPDPNGPAPVASLPVSTTSMGAALRSPTPIRWLRDDPDLPMHPDSIAAMRAQNIVAVAAVPLLHGSEALGVLGLGVTDPARLDSVADETLMALGRAVAAGLSLAGHVAHLEREMVERTTAERRLRESEERLREVTDDVDGVLYLLDPHTRRLLYASPSSRRLLGRELSLDATPEQLLAVVHPDDRERLSDHLRGRRWSERYELEYRVVRADGSLRWIVDRGHPVRDEHGEFVRVAGFAQDVTELRELEIQLRHSQKMEALGRLAGGIAHDFNNLLTVIVGSASMLGERFGPDDPDRETVRDVLGAAERAAALTRQLLAHGRRSFVEPRVVDLNEIVGQVCGMLRSLLGERIALEVELAPEPQCVRADRGQLEQVLVNLVANARDAIATDGRVRITTGRVACRAGSRGEGSCTACVRLRVEDDGRGMSAEVRERVFEPFFTTKPPGSGTGLGLATVYGIVRQAGGEIRVSSASGEGTGIDVDLPWAPEAADAERSPSPRLRAAGRGETLLLVEDEGRVRTLARRVLEGRGYRVLEACDGEDALRLAEDVGHLDLVLTDVVMPRVSGPELVERLQKQRPGLSVLYVSGYAGDGAGLLPEPEDGIGVLAKPFTPNDLAAAVRELLDAR